MPTCLFFFFCTLVTGPRRSLSLKLSDTRVYEPQIPVAEHRMAEGSHVSSQLMLPSGERFEPHERQVFPGRL